MPAAAVEPLGPDFADWFQLNPGPADMLGNRGPVAVTVAVGGPARDLLAVEPLRDVVARLIPLAPDPKAADATVTVEVLLADGPPGHVAASVGIRLATAALASAGRHTPAHGARCHVAPAVLWERSHIASVPADRIVTDVEEAVRAMAAELFAEMRSADEMLTPLPARPGAGSARGRRSLGRGRD